jgi:hypothetical protein
MKKNPDKTLKGRTKHEEHVPHCSTPNQIPTPYMQQREKEKRKRKKRNINPECKQKHAPLPHHQTKNANMRKKKKIDPQEREIIKPRKSIPPNYKHFKHT